MRTLTSLCVLSFLIESKGWLSNINLHGKKQIRRNEHTLASKGGRKDDFGDWGDKLKRQINKSNKDVRNNLQKMADSASSIDLNVPPIKFPKSESQKNSEMNFFSRDLSNETPGVPSSYSLELDDLRTFKDSMESFVAKEKAREIDERSYLPDPDLMRACMSASGASFEVRLAEGWSEATAAYCPRLQHTAHDYD